MNVSATWESGATVNLFWSEAQDGETLTIGDGSGAQWTGAGASGSVQVQASQPVGAQVWYTIKGDAGSDACSPGIYIGGANHGASPPEATASASADAGSGAEASGSANAASSGDAASPDSTPAPAPDPAPATDPSPANSGGVSPSRDSGLKQMALFSRQSAHTGDQISLNWSDGLPDGHYLLESDDGLSQQIGCGVDSIDGITVSKTFDASQSHTYVTYTLSHFDDAGSKDGASNPCRVEVLADNHLTLSSSDSELKDGDTIHFVCGGSPPDGGSLEIDDGSGTGVPVSGASAQATASFRGAHSQDFFLVARGPAGSEVGRSDACTINNMLSMPVGPADSSQFRWQQEQDEEDAWRKEQQQQEDDDAGAPTIVSFQFIYASGVDPTLYTPTKAQVVGGDTVFVTYQVTGADYVTIAGLSEDPYYALEGSIKCQPIQAESYTLVAYKGEPGFFHSQQSSAPQTISVSLRSGPSLSLIAQGWDADGHLVSGSSIQVAKQSQVNLGFTAKGAARVVLQDPPPGLLTESSFEFGDGRDLGGQHDVAVRVGHFSFTATADGLDLTVKAADSHDNACFATVHVSASNPDDPTSQHAQSTGPGEAGGLSQGDFDLFSTGYSWPVVEAGPKSIGGAFEAKFAAEFELKGATGHFSTEQAEQARNAIEEFVQAMPWSVLVARLENMDFRNIKLGKGKISEQLGGAGFDRDWDFVDVSFSTELECPAMGDNIPEGTPLEGAFTIHLLAGNWKEHEGKFLPMEGTIELPLFDLTPVLANALSTEDAEHMQITAALAVTIGVQGFFSIFDLAEKAAEDSAEAAGKEMTSLAGLDVAILAGAIVVSLLIVAGMIGVWIKLCVFDSLRDAVSKLGATIAEEFLDGLRGVGGGSKAWQNGNDVRKALTAKLRAANADMSQADFDKNYPVEINRYATLQTAQVRAQSLAIAAQLVWEQYAPKCSSENDRSLGWVVIFGTQPEPGLPEWEKFNK